MRWGELAVVLVVCATGAAAGQEYTCGPWVPKGPGQIEHVSVLKKMAVVTVDGRDETVRMARAHLDLRVYPHETGVYVIYGDPVRTDAGPVFGPRITIQSLTYDRAQPRVAQAQCEARK